MPALFEMSFESETLTKKELAEITGSLCRNHQIIWLKAHTWQFVITKSGDPIVGRLYARLKLAGYASIVTSTIELVKGPDLSKVR
ncbi:MAG: DUF4224 domain-containing protein [Moraxellaceae bacterium]|nr:DUF4224 domain-containing protein [Moraxellaceae bacterium]